MLLSTVLLATLGGLSAAAGVVRGRVTDPAGNPIPEVRIEVVDLHRHATTDAQGRYRVSDLPTGVYQMSFAAIGFRPALRRVTVPDGDVVVDIQLAPSVVELAALQVTASPVATDALSSPQPVSVLGAEELRPGVKANLGQVLEQQPGLRSLSTGQGIGKPVIRGLSSNRVLVAADGQRLENQQWGDEHAPSVEVGDLERIEVIRGPASVLYGSDAIGGVINVVRRPLPDAIGQRGFARMRAALGFASNGSAPDGLLAVDGASGGLGLRGMLSGRSAGNTRAPTGMLSNTGYDAWGGTLAAGLRGGWGNATVEYDHRQERLEFHEDPATEPDFTGYQRVNDDRVKATVGLPTGGSARVEIIAAYQRNSRREFEAAESPVVGLGLVSESWSAEGHLHHSLGRFAGIVGLSGLWNGVAKSGEETLVPGSSYGNLGLYAFEQTELGRWQLSFGARYDYRRLNVEDDVEFGVSAQHRDFGSVTGNLGLLYRVSGPVAIVLNAGRGYRAPSTFELFSNGVHPGTARFERGSPDLINETSFNTDLGLRVQTVRASVELGGFLNRVSNYIYPDPTDEFDPVSRFRIYQVAQGNATLVGFELGGELHPTEQVHLRAGADYVRGQNTAVNQPLVLIPPFRMTYGLRYEAGGSEVLKAPYLDFSGESNPRQSRPDPEELAPAGYTLFHLGVGAGVNVGRSMMQVDLSVRNLFDAAYTGFLSRYKEYALDAGRNLSLRLSTGF